MYKAKGERLLLRDVAQIVGSKLFLRKEWEGSKGTGTGTFRDGEEAAKGDNSGYTHCVDNTFFDFMNREVNVEVKLSILSR